MNFKDIKYKAWVRNRKQMLSVYAINWREERVWGSTEESPKGGQLEDFKDVDLISSVNLKDETRRDIFEDDIVVWVENNITWFAVAKYAMGFDLYVNIRKVCLGDYFRDVTLRVKETYNDGNISSRAGLVKVIGNLYQTPEVLES